MSDQDAAPPQDQTKQTDEPYWAGSLKTLGPLLGVLVGVLTTFVTLGVQQWGAARAAKVAAAEAERDQWRLALQKASFEDQNLLSTAFLMDTFSDAAKYKRSARAIQVQTLTKSNDPTAFDMVFFQLMDKTTSETQDEILWLDRSLAFELREYFESDCDEVPKKQRTFANYLANPELCYSNKSDLKKAANLKRTLNLIWELDSVSAGLCQAWADRSKGSANLSPDGQPLDGLVLMSDECSKIDFTKAASQPELTP